MIASPSAPFRRLQALFAAGVLPVAIHAQPAPPPGKMPSVVVTATRTPEAVTTVGSLVDSLSAAELARRQVSSLKDALGGIPGAPAFASGAPGSTTSLFLRGANSNQSLFLVDGVRFNDPNTDYLVWLGGACIGACDNLEVAHGPQSTLYGGEAVGGVVSLRAQRGAGPRQAAVTVEAGAFGTIQGALRAQAGDADTAWNFSAAGGRTDNDRPNNAFTSATYALRLDRRISDAVAVGATWRGFNGDYGSPGTRFTNDPDNSERESNQLATAFAEFVHAPGVTSRAVLGGQARRYVSDSPGAFGTSVTVVKNRRAVLDWQTTWARSGDHALTAGLTSEANHTRNTGFGDIDRRQRLVAVFVQDRWSPVDNLYFTAGLRSDDHDTFGRATTGRVTAAWLRRDGRLKARASYGTAFRAPSFLDLYGQSSFYVGNPDLAPEKAHGWDLGFDAYLPGDRGVLNATLFDTRFRDLVVFDFGVFPGTVRNVEEARTRGVELAGRLRLAGGIEARLSYTYLEATNETQGTRLLRRPRHSGSVDLWREFGAFDAGAGLAAVAGRRDVHASTFATIDGEDYAVARVYGSWRVGERLVVRARIENLLDEQYEEVHGYPLPGVGAYAGIEWRF